MEPIEKAFQDHIEIARASLAALAEPIAAAARLLEAAYRSGGKAVLFGNGGSACDALHVEGELLGRFRKDRKGLPAIALGGGIASLTALSNDYSYESAFARLAAAHVRPGDAVFAFSTSGSSANIVEAAKTARDGGGKVIAFTGEGGGLLRVHADVWIGVPSKDTARIQEMHLLACHILCGLVEESMFP
jgi:D-sedoheptulose 7-phosphate isomerase